VCVCVCVCVLERERERERESETDRQTETERERQRERVLWVIVALACPPSLLLLCSDSTPFPLGYLFLNFMWPLWGDLSRGFTSSVSLLTPDPKAGTCYHRDPCIQRECTSHTGPHLRAGKLRLLGRMWAALYLSVALNPTLSLLLSI
jgi:hypothetical protein